MIILIDEISKKFYLKFHIEKAFEEKKIRFCSVPYFVYKDNHFIKINNENFNDCSKEMIYYQYENNNYKNPNKKKQFEKYISKKIK